MQMQRSHITTTATMGISSDAYGGTINEGHFILFDRRPNRSWEEKIWHRTENFNGTTIEVWGM